MSTINVAVECKTDIAEHSIIARASERKAETEEELFARLDNEYRGNTLGVDDKSLCGRGLCGGEGGARGEEGSSWRWQ